MVFAGSSVGDFGASEVGDFDVLRADNSGASEVAENTGVEPAEKPVGTRREPAVGLIIVVLGSRSAKISEAR